MPSLTLIHPIRRTVLLVTLALSMVSCGDSVATRYDAAGDRLPAHAVIRLGSTRFLPYSNSTDLIAYSPDGRYVATAGIAAMGTVDCGVQIWDRAMGRDVTPTGLQQIEVLGMAWAPSGNRFVTTHRITTLASGFNIWTIGRNQPVGIAPKDECFSSVAWSPTGERIAVRTWTEECLIVDDKGTEKHRLRLPSDGKSFQSASVLAFSHDGKRLAIPSEKGVRICDVAQGTILKNISIEATSLNVTRFLSDDKSIAVAGDNGLNIIDINSGTVLRTLGEKPVLNFVVSANQDWVAIRRFDLVGNVSIRNFKTGALLTVSPEPTNGGIALSPDGLELAISTRRISFLSTTDWNQLPAHDEQRHELACGLLHKGRFWTGEYGNQVREWDLATGKPLDLTTISNGTARSLAIIDDQHLAVAGTVPQIGIYDLKTHRLTTSLKGNHPYCLPAISALKSRRLISVGWGQETDCVIKGWNLDTKTQEIEIPIDDCKATPVLAMAPNEEHFVCCVPSAGQIRLFHTSDGSELWSRLVTGHSTILAPVAFSADSRQVFCLLDIPPKEPDQAPWVIRCLDAKTGEEQSRLEGIYLRVYAIATSPDGQFAAASIRDTDHGDLIQIWSLSNRSRVATLKGHLDWAEWLGFTSDSKRLISLSKDSTGLIWDVESAIAHQASRHK